MVRRRSQRPVCWREWLHLITCRCLAGALIAAVAACGGGGGGGGSGGGSAPPVAGEAGGTPSASTPSPADETATGTPSGGTPPVDDGRPASLPAIGPISAPPVQAGTLANWDPQLRGRGLEFSWSFGDDTPDTGFDSSSAASHVYGQPGIYRVGLTVRAADGSRTLKTFMQAVTGMPLAGSPQSSSALLVEPRPQGGEHVWLVNPDNHSVSVFDGIGGTRIREIPTGASPHALARAGDGRIWVTNRDDASLSVIDPDRLAVERTLPLPRASQPFGIVFAPGGSTAFVALQATGTVVKLASANGATLGSVAVGEHPRHLALTADGGLLLVSRFISPPMPGEGTAMVSTVRPDGGTAGGKVVAIDAATMSVRSSIVLRHSDRSDNSIQGAGLPNYLGAAVIAPDGRQAWVPSKQDNVRRGTLRNGQNLNFQNTVRAISSWVDLSTLSEDPARRVDHDNAGIASAAAFDRSGAYLFVALETSREIAVIDARRGTALTRIEVGLAPQGVAVSADNLRLYVHNFMSRSLSIIDLSPIIRNGETSMRTPATVPAVDADRLPPDVLLGKQLFYDARDPRLARDGYLSCASCHHDGSHDGRTWDLTGFGEGLRNTISLRGRAGMGQGFLHWSGNADEVQDFEGQIRSLAGGRGLIADADLAIGTRSQPLGDRKAGLSADLDALAAYVGSLNAFAPSPYRNADGSMTAAASAGKAVFDAKNCASCHAGTAMTSSADAAALRDVGTIRPASGMRLGALLTGIDVPTLRDLWSSAPYLHDGSAATLADAVTAHRSGANPMFTFVASELDDLVEYLKQLGSDPR